MENGGGLWSRLPEELIHRILGFLTTKDALRASFASKSLQAAWLSSSPSLQFSHIQQHSSKYAAIVYQQFLIYVFTTMKRVSTHKINLQSFKFHTSIVYNSENLDKWIGFALDGRVCEISLSLDRGVWYCLPERVLTSSSFLKSLYLACGSDQLSLFGGGSGGDDVIINLPCLQSLTLIRVSIDEDSLERLLKGCPLLEHFKIYTELVSELKISHPKLKSLDLSDNETLDTVEVDAPCLEEFSYSNTTRYYVDWEDVIFKSSTSKNLKYLTLHLFTSSSMELWLSNLLPNFTSLETLNLRLCCYDDLNSIKISNPHVKSIALTHTDVAQIEIDCPMLLSLRWIARDAYGRSGLLSSLSAVMINHQPNFAAHLHIRHCCYTDLTIAWFHKLRELLSISRIAAMSLHCDLTKRREDVKNGDNESLPTSAVKMEQLYLMFRAGLHESRYSFIMNGFLSACHPDTIHLAQPWSKDRKELMHFKKFFRKKFKNWKDGDGCYCSSKIKCWKHQLKSVEVQELSKLEGKERDRYDFGILHHPPEEEPLSFRIKFQWY